MMHIFLPGYGPERRVPDLDFDADGPKIGPAPLLVRTKLGFAPLAAQEIDALLRSQSIGTVDSQLFRKGLERVARALNQGDIALAAVATAHLRLRTVPAIGVDVAELHKAGVNDPVPGWPAGTPGGRGGKFRPKDATVVIDPAREAERLARLERLKARRSVRVLLRRVLNAKRVARLLLEGLGEAVPGLEALDTAALIEDLAEIAGEVAEENAEVDAATAFVEQGPRTLEELTMGDAETEETFSSFDAFRKMDLDKRFGNAGEGYDYHHLVEQNANFTQAQLQSTSNIVRIPRLLHEEINAEFARVEQKTGMSLRESLVGKSFEEQRAAGLEVLRSLGVLYP